MPACFLCVAKCRCVARSFPRSNQSYSYSNLPFTSIYGSTQNQETKPSHFALMINAPIVTSRTERTMQNHIYNVSIKVPWAYLSCQIKEFFLTYDLCEVHMRI